MKAIALKTKWDPITDILLDNGNLSAFELYFSEMLKEFFQQSRNGAPVQFLPESKTSLCR